MIHTSEATYKELQETYKLCEEDFDPCQWKKNVQDHAKGNFPFLDCCLRVRAFCISVCV